MARSRQQWLGVLLVIISCWDILASQEAQEATSAAEATARIAAQQQRTSMFSQWAREQRHGSAATTHGAPHAAPVTAAAAAADPVETPKKRGSAASPQQQAATNRNRGGKSRNRQPVATASTASVNAGSRPRTPAAAFPGYTTSSYAPYAAAMPPGGAGSASSYGMGGMAATMQQPSGFGGLGAAMQQTAGGSQTANSYYGGHSYGTSVCLMDVRQNNCRCGDAQGLACGAILCVCVWGGGSRVGHFCVWTGQEGHVMPETGA